MWNRRHRWIRRFAAGLAFAALVVPTAQARIVEDPGIAVEPQQVVVDPAPKGGSPQVVAAPSTGMDWTDAGIGAGIAVGLMLLVLGTARGARHVGRKSLASA